MYYLNLDENGYLTGYFTVDTPLEAIPEDSPLVGIPAVESLDGLDLSGLRFRAHRWDGERLALDEEKLALLEERV